MAYPLVHGAGSPPRGPAFMGAARAQQPAQRSEITTNDFFNLVNTRNNLGGKLFEGAADTVREITFPRDGAFEAMILATDFHLTFAFKPEIKFDSSATGFKLTLNRNQLADFLGVLNMVLTQNPLFRGPVVPNFAAG